MAYNFNPTPAEAAVLAQISSRESSNNYIAHNPGSTASGAYQFIDSTWAMATAATGVPYYPTAASAPPSVQDANALYMLRRYGPNATITWAESAPAGGYDSSGAALPAPIDGSMVDLSGDAAATPTPSILDQFSGTLATAGVDIGSVGTDVVIGLGLAVVAWLVMR